MKSTTAILVLGMSAFFLLTTSFAQASQFAQAYQNESLGEVDTVAYQSPFLKYQGAWKVQSSVCVENGKSSNKCDIGFIRVLGPALLAQAVDGTTVKVHQWNCDAAHCQDVQDNTVYSVYNNSYVDDGVEFVHTVMMYSLNGVTYFSYTKQIISLTHPGAVEQSSFLASIVNWSP